MWRVFYFPIKCATMKYPKLPLNYEQQADLLLDRGLIADREELIAKLCTVNYYRLSAYWYPFKHADNTFELGTEFSIVWRRYAFDRQLRLLVMDAIERVEIALRARLAYELAHQFGAYAHLDVKAFPNIKDTDRKRLIDELHENAQGSREAFVEHFKNTYDGFPDMPIWAVVETMTFGQMFTMYRHCGKHTQRAIGATCNLSGNILLSWLFALNYVRNLCAHHSRLWNRELAIKPMIPDLRHDVRWYSPHHVPNNRIFVVLTLLRYLLSCIAPQSHWRDRLYERFDDYKEIPLSQMGIPADWRDHPIWK